MSIAMEEKHLKRSVNRRPAGPALISVDAFVQEPAGISELLKDEQESVTSARTGSQDHSRALIEAAPGALLEVDLDWLILSANPGLGELLRRDDWRALVGTDARALMSLEDRRPTETWLRDLARSGTARLDLQLSLIGPHAAPIPVQIGAAILRDPGGAPASAVLLVHDLSVRRGAEAAVRRARDYLSDVLNAIPTPIFVKDRNHRWIFCNEAFEAMMGATRESMIGRSDYEFVSKEHADVFWAKDEETFSTGTVNENEETIEVPTSGRRTLLTRKKAFRDENGEEVLVAVIADVTERKRAEEQLRLAAQVFEHSSQGIMLTQPDHCIVSVNRGFSRITGFAATEVTGRNARILGTALPESTAWRDVWRAVRQSGSWEGEVVNRSRDGQIYPAWLTVSAVRDDAGRLVQYVTLLADASERQAREERLRWLAQHDVLTDLPNRLLLMDRLRQVLLQARRSGTHAAVMMLDLDRFKAVNDHHGHDAGDHVLREAGDRLRALVREVDTLSRFGGDEFVIVMAAAGRAEAGLVADKLIATLLEPFDLDACQVTIGASIGIAVFPEDGLNADALLTAADVAMYVAKAAGGSARRFAPDSTVPDRAPSH
jgi:diguanylate cyclase (GGDEF)-like protein/PAS domain S-box-containing protein